MDVNKNVQKAACTAITHLQETTRINLFDYLQPMVQTYINALGVYSLHNRYILYDSIGIFSIATIKRCDNQQIEGQFVNAVVPSILTQWNDYQDDEKAVLNICECLLDIFGSVHGGHLQSFTPTVFNRCLRIIETQLILFSTPNGGFDIDILIGCINLLSTLVDVYKNSIEQLVAPSNLLGLIYRCMETPSKVRQEIFALLGDLCPYCISHIVNSINLYIPEIIKSLKPHPGRASGNGCWALSMIIRYCTNEAITPFADQIFDALKFSLLFERQYLEVLENSSVALGWLSIRATNVVASDLANIFSFWSCALADIAESEEKAYAFFGFCAAIEANPDSILNRNLIHLFEAFGSWEKPCDELLNKFNVILHQFKKIVPPNEWQSMLNSIRPEIANGLTDLYKI